MNAAGSGERSDPFSFWLAIWLAVVLVGAKAVDLGFPEDDSVLTFGRDLAVAAHLDVVFALGVALVSRGILRFRRTPVLDAVARALVLVFCLVSVAYAVLSVQIFTYLRSPVTYALIYLAGDLKNMQSSVDAFVTPRLIAALVTVPSAYAVVVWASLRREPRQRARAAGIGRAIGFVALAGYVLWAHRVTLQPSWIDRPDRLVAENPHWVIASSTLGELFGGSTVRIREPYPPEDLLDFRLVGERSDETAGARFLRPPRNVILLVLESTATRYLSLYGSRYPTTPQLQREARHALVFDDFYCHFGLTSHSLAAITLSIYPGMTWREYTVDEPDLPGTTMAQILASRGYRTAFLHSGDLEYGGQRRFLSNRGFEEIVDFRGLDCGPRQFSWGVEDRCLVDELLRWIDENRSRPFYALAWTIQAHHPYPTSPGQTLIDFFRGDLPPDDYDLGNYLNVLREVDRQVGRLIEGLRERGLAEDTLLAITGDHGEAFGDPHDTWGHGRRLYQENVNVPLILWNPRLFAEGLRSKTVGGHVDLNPTLADILGIPPSGSWQGWSLFDPGRPPRAYFYAADHDYMLGVREQNWKYIYDAKWGKETLFDLSHDATEQVNLAEQHPDRCRRLRKRLAAWLDHEQRHLERLRDDLIGRVAPAPRRPGQAAGTSAGVRDAPRCAPRPLRAAKSRSGSRSRRLRAWRPRRCRRSRTP